MVCSAPLRVVTMEVKIFACILASLFVLSSAELMDIQSQLPPEITNRNITQDMEDAKRIVKEKCKSVVKDEDKAENAFKAVENAFTEILECGQGLIDFENLQKEIDEASPKGELESVFNEYCKKRPDALNCVGNFTEKIEVCLSEDEQEIKNTVMKITVSLLDFVCYKGGNQIALFIAEKGPECLKATQEPIQSCVNSTFGKYQQNITDLSAKVLDKEQKVDFEEFPKIKMGPELCADIEEAEACIVKELERCSEITPANIVESLFRFIKKETECKNYGKAAAKQKANGVASNNINPFYNLLSFMLFAVIAKLTM